MSEEYIAATVKYNASGESTALPPHLSNGRYDQVDTTTLHKRCRPDTLQESVVK